MVKVSLSLGPTHYHLAKSVHHPRAHVTNSCNRGCVAVLAAMDSMRFALLRMEREMSKWSSSPGSTATTSTSSPGTKSGKRSYAPPSLPPSPTRDCDVKSVNVVEASGGLAARGRGVESSTANTGSDGAAGRRKHVPSSSSRSRVGVKRATDPDLTSFVMLGGKLSSRM